MSKFVSGYISNMTLEELKNRGCIIDAVTLPDGTSVFVISEAAKFKVTPNEYFVKAYLTKKLIEILKKQGREIELLTLPDGTRTVKIW